MSQDLLFSATITNNQSATRLGLFVLLGSLLFLSTCLSIYFLSRGAWPVLPFYVVELGIVFLIFYRHHQKSKSYEKISLSSDQLLIEDFKHSSKGFICTRWNFNPAWVRLDFDGKDNARSPLRLTEKGQGVAFGLSLTQQERHDLYQTLRGHLIKLRS
jgi:uncharacterized membrane protein